MKMRSIRHSRKGFTLLELIVWMTIFSMAITSIFLLLESTMKSVSISRNEIIVSNLLREQIELVRNVRDSNIKKGAGWDVARIDNDTKVFTGGVFLVQNDFSHTGTVFNSTDPAKVGKIDGSPVLIKTISAISDTDIGKIDDNAILKTKFEASQLCFDTQKRYVHCEGTAIDRTSSGTVFASYMHISPMKFKNPSSSTPDQPIQDENGKDQWFILDARVIVRDGSNYREYDAKSAITDWQR